MSGLRKPPSDRCDAPIAEGADALSARPPSSQERRAEPVIEPAIESVIEPADEPWQRLLAAAEDAGIPLVRLAPEQAVVLAGRGVGERTLRRLLQGYPAAPQTMGTLTFFPPAQEFHLSRRLPELFYVAEAWKGEHVFKRRLRASLETQEEPIHIADDDLDASLVDAAAHYLESIGARTATGSDGAHRFWLPGADETFAAHAGDESKGIAFAFFGPLMAWEDFRSELERRLMVARLWAILGLGAAVGVLSRSGALSNRLLLAFGALGILGGGLGLGPWMRAPKRLRELLGSRITLRSKQRASETV